MKLDPHGPFVDGLTSENPSSIQHNVTAYACALREANNMPAPAAPKPTGKKLYRSKVMAHPDWRQLAGSAQGWVLPEHVVGGMVKKENLPKALQRAVESTGRPKAGSAADGSATMTLHQKRKMGKRREKSGGRSNQRERAFDATSSSGISFESTLGMTAMTAWTAAGEKTTGSLDSVARKTQSRLNTLENTSFSIHEQPVLLSYCSTRMHSNLVSKAHEKAGARYRHGRRAQSAIGTRDTEKFVMPRAEAPIPLAEIPGKQKIGVQRGAGENGILRAPGKSFIVACPQVLTKTQMLSTYKNMHNTQSLRMRKKK